MVLVNHLDDLDEKFASASNEAQQAFGDGRLYVEKFITEARHVEVQILADMHGNVIHLGERDCSAQRRYQKVVEEAPAVSIPIEVREALHLSAVELCRSLDYVGAATVEFVVDAVTGDFAFLEVNTRVQVEHPVTELVTGIDIVREQLRIASGDRLSVSQADVRLTGHAVECRVNAEDARNNFMPTPGRVTTWIVPQGGGVRIDSHVYGGYLIPPYYDSMIAKVLTLGVDRDDALRRMGRALEHLTIDGVTTNKDFLHAVVADEEFIDQRHHTRWVEQSFLPRWTEANAAQAAQEAIPS
jgi:acetyl-CoA carboxylase biotin carboxylase subunit